MSIELYVNEEVVKRDGFEVRHRQSTDGQQWEEYYLPGIRLYREKGRFHINLHHLEEPIPKLVEDMVEEISFYEWIPGLPKRVGGVYSLKSAMGTLEPPQKEQSSYQLRIVGKKLEDIRELYLKIRVGRILPTESWEEKQISSGSFFFRKVLEKIRLRR